MVLQRAPYKAVIWGYANQVGDSVEVKMEGQRILSKAFQGEWQLQSLS